MEERCAAGDACIDVDLALAFVDGVLPSHRRVDVERRIDRCPRCRATVAEAARSDTEPHATVSGRRAWRRAKSHPALELEPGARVGRYVIERALGAGGMGIVHLARDPELKRAVVIKLVRPDVYTGEDRDELEARLRREAQAMAQLSHPNVVQIFDIGHHGDRVFIAMELVAGQTLDAWTISRPRSVDEILGMFRQAGAGLSAAHRAGLVHRDFKPTNVLVGSEGLAKVTDFGLARGLHPGASADTEVHAIPRASGIHDVLTHADAVVGTPAYMAPEQTDGRAVDARSDQFAFAVALVDALVAQLPTRRVVGPERLDAIAAALDRANVPPRARDAIVRALDPDPERRFPTMAELLRELAPPRRDRVRWWPIAIGLALCGIAVVLGLATRREVTPAPACVADAPRAWTADARAAVVAAFASAPPPAGTTRGTALGLARPFATWTGAAIASELDRVVARLGEAEIARCEGRPITDDACLARRQQALAAAIRELPRALDAPWPVVRTLERCEPVTSTAARLRAELRDTVAREPDAQRAIQRAEQIADEARAAGDDALAADALEVAGVRALASGTPLVAERLLRALAAVGDRTGDDAARGRALLHLLEVARWTGDHAAAVRDGDSLRSILARHGNEPRDVLAIALQEAATFTDVGDATRALAAWDQAIAAARALGVADGELAARSGRARALHEARFDLEGARRELAAALQRSPVRGPARADALVIQAELALAAQDATTATRALDDAHAVDPARRDRLDDAVRRARARAMAGDADGALAELARLRTTAAASDTVTPIRIDLARAEITRRAGRAEDARAIITPAFYEVRPFAGQPDPRDPAMPMTERLAVALEHCAVIVAAHAGHGCQPELVRPLHPRAPVRARFALGRLAIARHDKLGFAISGELQRVLEVYTEAGAPPLAIAELRWELARSENVYDAKLKREHALAARAAFEAARRTDEVRAIDAFLASGTDAGVGPAPRPARPSGDPWATAP